MPKLDSNNNNNNNDNNGAELYRDVVIDAYIGEYLRPHQIEGVKFLYGSVMGLHHPHGQGYVCM